MPSTSPQTPGASDVSDYHYLVRKATFTGYQLFSFATPPVYVAVVLSRHGRQALSINRVLRATWVGGLGGTVAGGSLAYLRYAYTNKDYLRDQKMRVAYNANATKLDDHATIGSILFGVLTPAILWNRASLVNLVLGGAGLGSSVGVLTHLGRSGSGDTATTTFQ